jgi:8-oxo-dGTP pyrophosphatase MutT (NUDIX family)
MKREKSAGGVVFNREIGKVLLIKDSYGRWALPKGHVEKGETSEQAALREISEETGLEQLKALAKLGQVKYFFNLKGDNVFKIVVFFLVEAKDTELKAEWEVRDVKWFSPDDALEKMEYANSKELMKKAVIAIKKMLSD